MNLINNKPLFTHSKHTPCQEVFQAVCDELGKYYENRGFKYSRSRSKITYSDDTLKLEISFWSSRSNKPGEWVLLEILPAFYSKQLAKITKTKGFLFGHSGLFYHKYSADPRRIKVKHIFGDEEERIDQYSTESLVIDSHTCNVYELNQYKFQKLTEFIDKKIIIWLNKLKTEQGIKELLTHSSQRRIGALNGKYGNSDFMDYVKLNFPNVEVEKMLS
ncbi:hypothetical protein GCM10028818_37570 [Spirosoma horti]